MKIIDQKISILNKSMLILKVNDKINYPDSSHIFRNMRFQRSQF